MLLGDLEDRAEFLVIQRLAVDVGMQLQPIGADGDGALPLLGGVGGVHGQGGEPAAEIVGVPGAELGLAVVGEAGEFLDDLGGAKGFQWGHAQ